ncbi:MAG: DUF4249 family protein [Chlorobi bacterium CHB2]|nr:DUF4249 family protein [Chlorobi bacterium CHB2]
MNRSIINRIAIAAAVVALLFSATGCEDLPPDAYIPQYALEGYLLVDKPITNISLTRSQSVTDTFKFDKGGVPNADVKIITGGNVYQLQYRNDNRSGGYFYPDTTVRVQPNTTYKIEVRTADGSLLTAQTITPERIAWITPPKSSLQYPVDTLSLPSPDSLKLRWTIAPNVVEYLISIRCDDTLEYGKYLEPSTGERNRRIERSYEKNVPLYNDVSRWGFLLHNETPTVWAGFKWFGRHTVTVYAANDPMARWYKLTHFGANPTFDPLYSNVSGGVGVFGAASIAESKVFVTKNQP